MKAKRPDHASITRRWLAYFWSHINGTRDKGFILFTRSILYSDQPGNAHANTHFCRGVAGKALATYFTLLNPLNNKQRKLGQKYRTVSQMAQYFKHPIQEVGIMSITRERNAVDLQLLPCLQKDFRQPHPDLMRQAEEARRKSNGQMEVANPHSAPFPYGYDYDDIQAPRRYQY